MSTEELEYVRKGNIYKRTKVASRMGWYRVPLFSPGFQLDIVGIMYASIASQVTKAAFLALEYSWVDPIDRIFMMHYELPM